MKKLLSALMLICGLFLFLFISTSPSVSADNPPYLIHWGQNCDPATISSNIDFIEQRPLDGLVIQSNALALNIMLKPMTYSEMVKCLEPLKKDTFKKFKHNLVLTYWGDSRAVENVPDFFDDWSYIIKNFGTLAKVCKDYGYDGVFIDNEDYKYHYWTYPDYIKYKDKSLGEYHLQARLRACQLMQAMCKVYPNIAVMSLHGPHESFGKSKAMTTMYSADDQLDGSFSAGIVDGAGPKAYGIDGGELYDLNTWSQFETAYLWAKYGLADPKNDVLFMDAKLRKEWSKKCNVAYGVYDKQAPEKKDWEWNEWVQIKNPNLLKERIKLALTRCDRYVWFYTETTNWMITPQDFKTIPGRDQIPTDEWVKAVREGKEEAQKGR